MVIQNMNILEISPHYITIEQHIEKLSMHWASKINNLHCKIRGIIPPFLLDKCKKV